MLRHIRERRDYCFLYDISPKNLCFLRYRCISRFCFWFLFLFAADFRLFWLGGRGLLERDPCYATVLADPGLIVGGLDLHIAVSDDDVGDVAGGRFAQLHLLPVDAPVPG